VRTATPYRGRNVSSKTGGRTAFRETGGDERQREKKSSFRNGGKLRVFLKEDKTTERCSRTNKEGKVESKQELWLGAHEGHELRYTCRAMNEGVVGGDGEEA